MGEWRMRRCLSAALLVLVVAPVPASRAASDTEIGDIHWTVALGLGARPYYEGSDRYRAIPIGALRARWDNGRYVELTGPESSGSAARVSAKQEVKLLHNLAIPIDGIASRSGCGAELLLAKRNLERIASALGRVYEREWVRTDLVSYASDEGSS